MNSESVSTIRSYLLVWVGLMTLLFMSLGSAYVYMGPFNVVANLVIALCKMALVALFFMHLKRASPLIGIVSGVGLVWLLLMFGLSLADFLTRNTVPPPW
jgi:cytochrome c oxidase subunit IV